MPIIQKLKILKKDFFTQKSKYFFRFYFKTKIKSKSPLKNEMEEFIKCINYKKKPASLKKSINILKTLKN